MKVNNVNGTTGLSCKCGGWLKHWVKHGGQTLSAYCSEATCLQKPELGAYVQKDSGTDTKWYIVPLCSVHNKEKGKSLTLSNSVVLVPANVSNTCG